VTDWGASQEEEVPIWGMGRRETHRWRRAMVALLGWTWTPVRSRRKGRSRSRRGRRAARWRGEAHRWFSCDGEPSKEDGTGEALAMDEELSVGYFGLAAADGSWVTPSLRRVLSA
jgi:hypothetical protein